MAADFRGTLLAALMMAVPASAADGAWDAATLRAALMQPKARAAAVQSQVAAGRGDAAALAALHESLHALEQPARAVLEFESLIAIGGARANPALVAWLEDRVRHGGSIRVWHEDEGHRVEIDAYDARAAARFALRNWRRQAARREALAELPVGGLPTLHQKTDIDEIALAGYADALADAPLALSAAAGDDIAAALRRGMAVEPLAAALVVRTGDERLAAELLQHGTAAFVIPQLNAITAALAPGDALAVLEAALARPELASAAIGAIGQIAPRAPTARLLLYACLADPALGAGAAAALAASADAETVAALAQWLHDEQAAPLLRARAALGLKLEGGVRARGELQKFAAAPDAPSSLRAVVVRWLD